MAGRNAVTNPPADSLHVFRTRRTGSRFANAITGSSPAGSGGVERDPISASCRATAVVGFVSHDTILPEP
jgi:hypothetical protein